MDKSKTAPLSEADVASIIRAADSDRLVLVGGQSIYFWKQMYSSKSEWLSRNNVTSEDVDFMNDMPAARNLARHFDVPLNVPGVDDSTPSAASLRLRLDDRYVIVDFMRSIQGVSEKDLRKRAVLVNMGLAAGNGRTLAFNVMHPFDCLVSRFSNINGPLRRIDSHSRLQAEASVEIMKCHLLHLLELGKSNEVCRLLQPLEFVIRDNHVGKNSHKLFGKHLDLIGLLKEFEDDERLHPMWREKTLKPLLSRVISYMNRKEARDFTKGMSEPGYQRAQVDEETLPAADTPPQPH